MKTGREVKRIILPLIGLPGQATDHISKRRQLVEQAGAICYCRQSNDFLLITSRRSGRWGVPKGDIDPGETSVRAAEREAFEEAGVRGSCRPEVLGDFTMRKDGTRTSFRVSVHLLDVDNLSPEFPEKGQRAMRWVPLAAAIDEVEQNGLREIFRKLASIDLTASV